MWLVAVWIVLPMFLGLLVGRLFHAFAGWLDRRHPDDLPLSAGEWLKEQIDKHKLPVRALPARKLDESANHYVPAARLIVLEQMVFYKPDPGAWATAAHELGHALFHLGNPRLGVLFITLRRLPRLLASAAVVMVGGNLLYASPAVDRVALGLLIGAAALSLFAIAEEVIASRRAIALLDEDGRLDARGRRAARLELTGALATYVSDLVGQLLAIALFPKVRAVVEARRFVAAVSPLGRLKAALAGGATALLGARLGRMTKQAMNPLWDLPVVLFAAMVWDQPGLMNLTLLAAVSAMRLLSLVLFPLLLIAGIVASLATPRARREISKILLEKLALGEAEIAAAAGPIQDAYALRTWPLLFPDLALNLLFLPLVLQYWLHLLFT